MATMGCYRVMATAMCVSCACTGLFGFDEPSPIAILDASPTAEPGVNADAIAMSDVSTVGDALACTTQGVVCDQPIAVECGGTCWVGCADPVTQAVAVNRCVSWGGKLARLTDAARDACLRSTVVPTGEVWIGLEQALANDPLEGWTWNSDGIALTFTSFESSGSGNQPDDLDRVENGQEQCAFVAAGRARWSDTSCAESRGFACTDGP